MTTALTAFTIDGQEVWTISRITVYLEISSNTFTAYVSRGQAPAPAYTVEHTRLWRADDIRQWHTTRSRARTSRI